MARLSHRLGHHVGDGSPVAGFLGQCHVDPVFALLHGKGVDPVVVASGRVAGARVEVPAMPRTAEPAVFDRSLAEGSALMRAAVVQRRELALVMGQGQAEVAGNDRFDSPLG